MRDSPKPNPRFTGLFIPAEVLDIPDLSPNEIILLAWIDALYNEEYKGCFASNTYFSEKLRVKEDTITRMISKLKEKDLIEQVSFDGRTRILRASKENWFKEKNTESEADSDLNPRQTRKKILGRPGKKSGATYIENKEENKANNTPLPPKGKAPIGAGGSSTSSSSSNQKKKQEPNSKKKAHRDHVTLTEEQYCKLLELYGAEKLKAMLDYLDVYKGSKGLSYKSDYHVLLPANWLNKRYEEEKEKEKRKSSGANYGNNTKGDARKRQLDSWVENNGDPNENPNILRFDK